jgi:hypothetical protein
MGIAAPVQGYAGSESPVQEENGLASVSGVWSKECSGIWGQYLRLSVVGFTGVLRVEAAVPVSDVDGLFVGRVISSGCEFEALGELIRVVFQCSSHLAEKRPWED